MTQFISALDLQKWLDSNPGVDAQKKMAARLKDRERVLSVSKPHPTKGHRGLHKLQRKRHGRQGK